MNDNRNLTQQLQASLAEIDAVENAKSLTRIGPDHFEYRGHVIARTGPFAIWTVVPPVEGEGITTQGYGYPEQFKGTIDDFLDYGDLPDRERHWTDGLRVCADGLE